MQEQSNTPTNAFGQPANTKEFEKYLKKEIKDAWKSEKQFKGKKNYWKIYEKLAIIFLSLFIISIVGTVTLAKTCGVIPITFAFMTLEVISFFLMIIFYILFWVAVDNPPKAWYSKQTLPNDIYEQYYKLVYPNAPLKFKGIRPSSVFENTNAFVFVIHDELIEWNITENEVEQTEYHKNGPDTTYFVYLLAFALVATVKKLDGYEEITITKREGQKPDKNDQTNEFISSSMSFNKKYKVTSESPDQLQVTKIFDPSVIHYFDETQFDIFPKVTLNNGKAVVSWISPPSLASWDVDLDNWMWIHEGWENDINEITNKITRDFNYFFQIFEILRPFDFYHLYPQLS